MDIYEAITMIEKFLGSYGESHGADPAPWAPTETNVLPSGDENNTIKIWFNFGPDVDEAHVKELLRQFEDAVTTAHPEVKQFDLAVRGDAM
jgi:hypothetical protein